MKIRNKEIKFPIIQGGMGIGISMGNLAGNVAKNGGIGIISIANVGFTEEDFLKNSIEANKRALASEIKKAKEISMGNGLIGINAMVAGVQYEDLIKVAIENNIDCIISGAGIPLHLPKYTKDSETLIAPIVSSGKSANVVLKFWDKKYNCYPDFIVIEGSKAGGHLGFNFEEIVNGMTKSNEEILEEVKLVIEKYEKKYEIKIPIFLAGSINSKEKIENIMKSGADGVQVATRFIATEECDASLAYKKNYIDAKNKDIVIIKSPVGMPGRALNTPFIKRIAKERVQPKYCINCIHTCNSSETLYCITNALIKAQQGNYEEGLFFCDDDVEALNKITTVKEVMEELTEYWR